MRATFVSLGIALLVAVLVWASIIFLDPGMNLDKAFNILVGSFIGSAVLTALVLMLRGRPQ
jgi:presenilin-like A22 family membrane protease